MPRWVWAGVPVVALCTLGSCVGVIVYGVWYVPRSPRMLSFKAHTSELQMLLERGSTVDSVLRAKGAPLLRSDQQRSPLSLEDIPDSHQLPLEQRREAR